ncbi:MAG TPA: NADH-quinone oxidoreductase subunit L [Acidimicrobiia bacterium]|nr:NADH-quinone oxidoreductase subunit L [Acidimicrobiia bacterium]
MTGLVLAVESGAADLVSGGFFAQWAGVMLVSPFVAFLLIIFFGKRLKYLGAELAIGAMGLNLLWASVLFVQNMGSGIFREENFQIASIGMFDGRSLVFELGWVVDGLSIMMYFVVAFVGLLVFIYAVGYMHGDVRVTWFFASLSLFAGSMLILVGAPNLIQLIIGWEGVGLASYLLIGHYWEQKENTSAAMKAFYTNKVADVGLILGAILLGLALGDFSFSAINEAAANHAQPLEAVAFAGGLLLFFGAMGKSAQFPLHIWLPDAMAGPTPVSALMHAATMVTAGIYLMARTFPVYQNLVGGEEARAWMVPIGAITLFAMGLLALVADDIKKVLAYSTVSQLGYMMTAVAAGGYTAGLFHLFTHAFFKALLFLGAGSVIHAVHSNNMSDMGGLRKDMPRTFWTFVIGSLSLAGIIPLAGFFSKDEILATLDYEGYQMVMWIAIAGAFVTAFYMTRAVALTFFGTYKGHGHPHESPALMTVPLVILAVPSVIAGFLNVPGVTFGGFGNFTTWVGARVVPMGDHHPEALDWTLAAYGLAAGGLGILLGWMIFGRDAESQAYRDRFEIPLLYPLLREKYYMDHLALGMVAFTKGPSARAVDWINTYVIDGVINGVGGGVRMAGRFVYGGLDQRGIDMVFNGLSAGADSAGLALRKLQTGRVQQYAMGFVVGALVLVLAIAVFN